MSKPTDPRNFRPPERIAVLTLNYGVYGVEFSQRHGSRVEKMASKSHGPGAIGRVCSWNDARHWIQDGDIPEDAARAKI